MYNIKPLCYILFMKTIDATKDMTAGEVIQLAFGFDADCITRTECNNPVKQKDRKVSQSVPEYVDW